MRAYLPISQSDLCDFLESGTFSAHVVFAPTESFVNENLECDEEEIEYLLSMRAGESALQLCNSVTSPGIVLAIEMDDAQSGESIDEHIKPNSPIMWSQVQCALLAYANDDELTWFATQEISQEIQNWI